MTVTDVTANSITLSITALPSVTRYQIFYTTDGKTFLPVTPPTGQGTRCCRIDLGETHPSVKAAVDLM